MKTVISRFGTALTVILALAGCGNTPSGTAQNTAGTSSSTTAAPIVAAAKITNACGLLTRQEVGTAMSVPVKDGDDGSHDKAEERLPWPSCTWNAEGDAGGGVTLVVKSDTRLDDGCSPLEGLGHDACAISDADSKMWELEAMIGDQMLGVQFVDGSRDVAASKASAVSLLRAALARVK